MLTFWIRNYAYPHFTKKETEYWRERCMIHPRLHSLNVAKPWGLLWEAFSMIHSHFSTLYRVQTVFVLKGLLKGVLYSEQSWKTDSAFFRSKGQTCLRSSMIKALSLWGGQAGFLPVLSGWPALTEYRKSGGLMTHIYFLQFRRLGSLRSGCQNGWVLLRALLVCRLLPSCYITT